MSSETRTDKAIKNAIWGVITQIAYIVMGFVSRTVFIHLLNADYLGVNGLFTNILTILSFAELGIGNAIVFSLYKPIAEDDKPKIQALMKLYRKAYWLIGSLIFIVGLCVIPFMKYVVTEQPNIKENLILIYVLFLLNTSLSYFWSYKKTLITANQKDYIVQIYTKVFQLIQIVAQSVFLLLTHDYLTYLIIYILCTILSNFVLSCKADKMYPFIRKKSGRKLTSDETKSIFDNVKALFVYKFGSIILGGTDNIIISSIIGVSSVGVVSNYTMLINSITSVIGQAVTSVTATVGNLSIAGSKEQIRKVMHQMLLICVWLYGFVSIGFLVLANEFVFLWIGSEYLLSVNVVIAIVSSIYIVGVQYPAYVLRTTQGLFIQSKWIPLIAAGINVVLSIWWGKTIGLAGIFWATCVSRILITVVDSLLVYKNNFHQNTFEYFGKYTIETVAVVVNAIIQWYIIENITLGGWNGFLVKGVVICITTNIVFLLEFGWTKDFKELVRRLLSKK